MIKRQGVFANNFCTNGNSFSNCFAQMAVTGKDTKDWTILNPGSCTCPSDCSGHGVCTESGCRCDAGYTGVDCASIRCSNQSCSDRGECGRNILPGVASCTCDPSYSLGDCSATMPFLPAIPSLLPDPQYTDWDIYGDQNPIFNESTIAQIYINISQDDLNFLINPVNMNAREYLPANFSFYNGATTQLLENVGMRIQGGASRNFAKKSWKISFSHFEKGRTWAQQQKISLKDTCMDSMSIREKSSMAAFYAIGAKTQRMSYAVVNINKMNWGLYVMIEDSGSSEFLNSRFGNADGSLWKCSGTLAYLGSDPDDYRNSQYKAENNNANKSYAPLENFISVLNLTPDDQFEDQIQTVMDVEFFLRSLAAEVSTGNFDGIYNGNNYFLYYNTDRLMYYYRHDLDLSFGSFDYIYRMENRSIWNWGSAFPRGRGHLLIDRILSVPSFQEIYSSYLSKLMTYVNADQSGTFADRVNGLHSSIQEAVAMDAWHSLDGDMYSYTDYEMNLQQPLLRSPFWPAIPHVNVSEFALYDAFFSWLKNRNSFTENQLQSGPPSEF